MKLRVRGEKKFDLLVELLYLMAQSLDYKDIDKAAIRDYTYVPQGYANRESEDQQMRKALSEVLGAQRPLTVTMLGPVQVEQPMKLVEEIFFAPTSTALPGRRAEPATTPAECSRVTFCQSQSLAAVSAFPLSLPFSH